MPCVVSLLSESESAMSLTLAPAGVMRSSEEVATSFGLVTELSSVSAAASEQQRISSIALAAAAGAAAVSIDVSSLFNFVVADSNDLGTASGFDVTADVEMTAGGSTGEASEQ